MFAPASHAYYQPFHHYDNPYGSQFNPQHPDYYDGNLRYKLKHRADIERASGSNIHYDQYKRDYYRCDWKYNKNLRTWVCEKDYGRSQTCPFGYTKHPIQNNCVPIRMPANAHLNAQGNGWVCDSGYHINYARTGCERDRGYYTYYPEPISQPTEVITTKYVYVYDNEVPPSLPSTGSGIGLILLGGTVLAHRVLRRKKK